MTPKVRKQFFFFGGGIGGVPGIPGLGFFPKKKKGIWERSHFPKVNGNPGLKFSIGRSGIRCFVLSEPWELKLFLVKF